MEYDGSADGVQEEWIIECNCPDSVGQIRCEWSSNGVPKECIGVHRSAHLVNSVQVQ